MLKLALAAALLVAAPLSVDAKAPQTRTPAAVAVCAPHLHRATTAEMYFGRNVGDEAGVTDEDWRGFVDAEISPRFPDGLSVTDVYGQWRRPTGGFVREQTKAVMLVLSGAGDEHGKLDAIRDAYKTRFHQDSVLLIERTACVSF